MADVASGSPRVEGTSVNFLRLVFIFLWHPAMFIACERILPGNFEDSSRFWHDAGVVRHRTSDIAVQYPWEAEPRTALLIQVIFSGLIGFEAALAYIPFRFVVRTPPLVFGFFVRCWWKSCYLTALPLLALFFVLAWLPAVPWVAWLWFAPLAGFVALPALMAHREVHPKPRLSRWRPVCPECGYSLRRLVSERCPECGVPFPTSAKTFRRWAVLRLPWDRAHRPRLIWAYATTLFTIIFRPCRAARGLAVPDRMDRAIRWAAMHVFFAAILGTVLGPQGRYTWHLMRESSSAQDFFLNTVSPASWRIVLWAVQAFIAWLVVFSALPVLAVFLSWALPKQHPAARSGCVKWALYALPAAMFLLAFNWGIIHAVVQGRWFSFFNNYQPSILLLTCLYGSWWAVGCAANPYLRRRGYSTALALALLYLGSWLLCTGLLFAPKGLEHLL